ncbi:MAG: hypothetical protein AAB368_13235, partial [bacterium]
MIINGGLWALFLRGGVTMWVLALCSVVSLGVVLERWLYYRKCRVNVRDFFLKFRRGHKRDDLGALIVLCD